VKLYATISISIFFVLPWYSSLLDSQPYFQEDDESHEVDINFDFKNTNGYLLISLHSFNLVLHNFEVLEPFMVSNDLYICISFDDDG